MRATTHDPLGSRLISADPARFSGGRLFGAGVDAGSSRVTSLDGLLRGGLGQVMPADGLGGGPGQRPADRRVRCCITSLAGISYSRQTQRRSQAAVEFLLHGRR